jgi:hypothetical protein
MKKIKIGEITKEIKKNRLKLDNTEELNKGEKSEFENLYDFLIFKMN